jgi:hypothetical protein
MACESKTGPRYKVQSRKFKLAKLGARERPGFDYIYPQSSMGAKGAESGDKRRQIRRPFHSDVRIPRFKPNL